MDLKSIPKADIHRHLEGSIRLETLVDIAKEFSVPLPFRSYKKLRQYFQITEHDPQSFTNYLSKFTFYRRFWVNKESIERAAFEAVEDAANDNVKYLELRFSPIAFGRHMNFPTDKVAEWIINSARKSAEKHSMQIIFIATVVRHFSFKFQEPVLDLAINSKGELFSGVDLAGNELYYNGNAFIKKFRLAKKKGLGITIHAGEVREGIGNIRQAIEQFEADRIGQGQYATEDPKTIELSKKHNITYEVCPTSNKQTGGWNHAEKHPAYKLVRAGVKITINSDNPQISNTKLTDEFALAIKGGIITKRQVNQMISTACEAAFVSDERKRGLKKLLLGTRT